MTTVSPATPLTDPCGAETTRNPASPAIRPEPRRLLAFAALAVVLVCILGVCARALVVQQHLDQPWGVNIFYVLYARHELPFMVITGVFALLVLVSRGDRTSELWSADFPVPTRSVVGLLAVCVLLAGWWASSALFHQYALSMDEYSAQFQARIFASGQLSAAFPAELNGIAAAITPIYSTHSQQLGSWTTMYLPVYSAIRAAFLVVGAEWITNPVLTAASLLLLPVIARRLWPGDGGRQWLALLFMVTSSQFLITAGTAYAMPAHLCLNLLWFWLWLRSDRASLIALPIVGVIALGLHNPFPHALFAAPFLLYMLTTRQWRRMAWTFGIYAAGSLYWLHWLEAVQPQAQAAGASGLVSLFHLPTKYSLVIHTMNLTLLATWQTPVVALGLLAAMRGLRSLAHPFRELAYGIILTFGFYLLFPSTQGHGWGYRYMFPALGGVVLLAADGWSRLATEFRPRAGRILLVAGLGVMLVQIPVRATEVETTVRPFAYASEYLHTRSADVVVIPAFSWWYGQDLVRNDPLFERTPLVVGAPYITEAQFRDAVAHMGGAQVSVETVPYRDLARFGLQPNVPPAAATRKQ